MSDADYLESFSVTCPRCDCSFQPNVRQTSYFAKCPDCAEPVRVPASAEIEEDWRREQAADGETYRLSLPTDWEETPSTSVPKSKAGKAPSRATESPESPPSDLPQTEAQASEPPASSSETRCPHCGAGFEVPPSDQAQVVLCPECLEDVPVPPQSRVSKGPDGLSESAGDDSDEIVFAAYEPTEPREPADSFLNDLDPVTKKKTAKRKKKKKQKPRDPDPSANPQRGNRPEKSVNDTLAEVRRVEEEPPPTWTFFTGVTDFLIRPSVLIRWIYASVGFCLLGWMLQLSIHFFREFPLVLPFFVLPMIWIAIMSLSYAAACSMPILLETSAGNDKVEGWPEPVVKEQAVDLVYLSFLLIVAEVISFFLGKFVGVIFGPEWLVWGVLSFLVYPVVLLSSLEANSPFVPISLPILRSFLTVPWAWGAFYGLSFAITMAWVLPTAWVMGQTGWVQFSCMFLIAPLAAGWCFLYARILGRLAWRASLAGVSNDEEDQGDEKRKKPKRKTKPKVSESSGELQAAR